MSTHDIFRAKTVADVVGIMNEGRLVMQRTRKELEHEDLEKLYLQYMSGSGENGIYNLSHHGDGENDKTHR